MPNPNYAEMALKGVYGPDEDTTQSTKIYSAVSEDSDQIDHKYVEEVYMGGKYVELAHYASVKQIVIENMSTFQGVCFHTDATTGAVVPDYVIAGEHVTINNPDCVAGIMLYARFILEASEWHIAIMGSLT